MLFGETVDGRRVAAQDDVDQSLRAAPLGELHEVVQLSTRHVGQSRSRESLHDAAPGQDRLEYAKLRLFHRLAQIRHFKSVAEIRAVGSVLRHRLGVRNARERLLQDFAFGNERLEERRVELLDQVEDVVLVDEAHFEVELRELRLPVAARVLVAEALGDLKILFHPRRHEELLELLRRLRQSVELAGVQPARNEIVSRALRRALDENRSLDVEEAAFAEEVADELHRPVAHDQHVTHSRAT